MDRITSRERVRKTMNHEEPDRIPVDIGGFTCGIHELAYKNLARYLNLDVEYRLYDYWQRLVFVDERILEMFHVDTRNIFAGAGSGWEFKEEADQSWVDEWGIRRKRYGHYYHVIENDCPLREVTIYDLAHYPFPDPTDPARFDGLREKAKRMYQETDYALILANMAAMQGSPPSDMVGWQLYLMNLGMNQDFIVKLTDLFLEWWTKFFDKALDACGDYIEMVWLGDDWGTQEGPLIDPKVFRKIFKPKYKELVEFIKTKTEAKVGLHSCGSVYWAIQDFIDVGIDALNPVQVRAKDMDTKKLKKEFGDRIVFWGGGCDTQKVLPSGTPNDVRKEVKKRISDLAPGGGFVFATVHNILAEVPPENIVTMYNTVAEHGKYPGV